MAVASGCGTEQPPRCSPGHWWPGHHRMSTRGGWTAATPTPTMTGSGLWACTGRQVASQSKPDTKDRERVVARQGLCFIVGQSEDARAAQPARPQHAARPRAGAQMLTRLPPPHNGSPECEGPGSGRLHAGQVDGVSRAQWGCCRPDCPRPPAPRRP